MSCQDLTIDRRLWTPEQVAARWQKSRRVVAEMMRWGQIPAMKVGGSWRVKEDDLLEYENSLIRGVK